MFALDFAGDLWLRGPINLGQSPKMLQIAAHKSFVFPKNQHSEFIEYRPGGARDEGVGQWRAPEQRLTGISVN